MCWSNWSHVWAHALRQVESQRPQPTRPSEPHPPIHPLKPNHNSPECLFPWVVVLTLSWPLYRTGRHRFDSAVLKCVVMRLDSGQVSPPGPPGAAQWILNRMRLHSCTALRSPLSLPVIPNTINSIILQCQPYSATLSGHLLSQRPHPDVQARVYTEDSDLLPYRNP